MWLTTLIFLHSSHGFDVKIIIPGYAENRFDVKEIKHKFCPWDNEKGENDGKKCLIGPFKTKCISSYSAALLQGKETV